jgi:N-acetylmuramoyl-L-alanine amidase
MSKYFKSLNPMRKTLIILILFFITNAVSAQETPKAIFGKTTGDLPFLEYGMGKDRLGGAKMTYLDTGIVMRVVDSVKSSYLVQLSKSQTAYIPKNNFTILPKIISNPLALTQSWSVYGDDNYDYVRVNLETRLPYRSMQEINPSRIVVDIFGAVSNTNWITQLRSVKEIKNVYHEQIENDVFRVTIELNHQQHWGYSVAYVNKSLVIKVKRQPKRLKASSLAIAIDAGHGGSAIGAGGITKDINEKTYTLIFAKELENLLNKKGSKTFMTRTEDKDVSMSERIAALKKEDPNILISLHLNSSSNKNAKGTSTYYRYIGFRPLSQAILNRMLDLDLKEYGNIGSFNFSLNGPTEYPNCLVEIAFISNEEDEKKIIDPKFHKQVAKQIYKGINDWLKANR